jgi:cyclic di-GMP phosphodiesterase
MKKNHKVGSIECRNRSAMGSVSLLPAHTSILTRGEAVTHAGRILVVDDEPSNVRLLTRLLAQDGHIVSTACDGQEALDLVARDPPDLVLMDVMMPCLNGFDACREMKRHPATRLMPVVLLTALQDFPDKIRGLDVGADDFLIKPFNQHELRARVRSLLRLKAFTDDLESAESVILSLALTIEARDAYTVGHCQRLAAYGTALGRELGLGEDDLTALERGGFLHDIGKVGVADAILLKRGPLDASEYELMKQHTVIGDRLCGNLRSLARVRPIVRHHHERLDGGGYPDGLSGDAVPLLAQILSIVDLFDAMTTTRPYRAARTTAEATAALSEEVACGWRRADLVDRFIALVVAGRLPHFEVETAARSADRAADDADMVPPPGDVSHRHV